MYDVVVIGTGISGACAARELSRYDLKVAVLEKGYDLCAGASRTNSATVHSGHDAAYGSKKAYYNVRGNAMFDRMCSELHVPFKRNGTVIFAAAERDMEEVRRLKINADRNGVPGVEVLDRDGLLALEGYFGPEVLGGLYAPSGGIVCPYNLVFALCENAAANGAEFYLNAQVVSIEKMAQGFRVCTPENTFETRFIFNCAGVGADLIHNMACAPAFRILPRKGEHIILDKKLAPFVKSSICQTPSALPGGGHTKGMGVMPSMDGTIVLGCDAHDVEDRDDVSTTPVGLGEITQYFKDNWRHLPISRVYPDYPAGMVISAFAGLRPHPDTDDFIIGEVSDTPGFFDMAGIESPGVTAAPAIAAELVAEAAGRYRFVPKAEFNPVREKPVPFREMTPEQRVAAIAQNPDYAKLVCRCEQVTRAEVLDAIRGPLGARTVNGVKMRTRAGMGRCQGGFCGPDVVKLLAQELQIPATEVCQCGAGSNVLTAPTCMEEAEG